MSGFVFEMRWDGIVQSNLILKVDAMGCRENTRLAVSPVGKLGDSHPSGLVDTEG